MLSIVSGLVAVGVGATGLWYFMPRNGVVHPLARKPFFDSFITIAIMTFFVIGLALVIDGIY